MSEESFRKTTFDTSTFSAEVYHKQLETISKICDVLAATQERKINYRKVTEALAEVFAGEGADIHLRTITGDYFVSCATYGEHFGQVSRGDTLVSISTGRMAEMLKTGQPLIMNWVKPDSRDKESKIIQRLGYLSSVTTPIRVGGQIIGMFSISKKEHWIPSSFEIEYLLIIGCILGVAIQNTAHLLHSSMALPENITPMDKKLLTLISQGLSNEEISTELFISVPSIKRHITVLMRKLGLETRTQMAVFAAHTGLV
jgi:DNA-binding CsgD family transcriptional regulator